MSSIQEYLTILMTLHPFVYAFFGGAISAILMGLYLSFRLKQIKVLHRLQSEAENTLLEERIRGQEQAMVKLGETIDQQQEKIALLQEQHHIEFEKRVSAEERNKRIPELEELYKEKEKQLEGVNTVRLELTSRLVEMEATMLSEKKAIHEKLLLMQETEKKWTDLFKGLSADALRSNNQSFLELAKSTLEKYQEAAHGDLEKRQLCIHELVKPVKDSLDRFDVRINELEKTRTGAYESLVQQVRQMMETQTLLRAETGNLVKALRSPIGRGRWGEIQLRRVVEMAGMLSHCDFFEQENASTEDGRFRPDLLVRLPSNKNIVVDAKAPLSAYLESIESHDEEKRKIFLKDHARQVRAHIVSLGRKSYWDQFQPTPEFVILFLPGEIFFSAALEQDPTLIEAGVEQNVILATPTTLIALLRAVAYGWSNEAISQNAKKMGELGREIYKRLTAMSDHWRKVGKNLSGAVEAYNQATGSLESRVLVCARQFHVQGLQEIEELPPVEKVSRDLQAPEMLLTQVQ